MKRMQRSWLSCFTRLFLPAGREKLMSLNVSRPSGKGTTTDKNARPTPKGREELIRRPCHGERPAEVAQATGIS